MDRQRFIAIADELGDILDLPELKALWCDGQVDNNEYGDAACVPLFKAAVKRLKPLYCTCATCGEQHKLFSKCAPREKTPQEQLVELLAEVERLKAVGVPRVPVKASKRYKLLKLDVSWSTKPQVMAIAKILGAHAAEGDVLDEGAIVEMMCANERVLDTRQGGKRVWDYYKGNHAEGLVAHGNIERV